jgi:hypothetical protein
MSRRPRTAKSIFAAWWLIVLSLMSAIVAVLCLWAFKTEDEEGLAIMFLIFFGFLLAGACTFVIPGVLLLLRSKAAWRAAATILCLEVSSVIGTIVWQLATGYERGDLQLIIPLVLYGMPLTLVLLDKGQHQSGAVAPEA